MARYLIQEAHKPEECLRTLDAYMQAGSHFLTHSDWGCGAGVHQSWLIVEAANEEQARLMIPPAIRASAELVRLNRFTPEQVRELHGLSHQKQTGTLD